MKKYLEHCASVLKKLGDKQIRESVFFHGNNDNDDVLIHENHPTHYMSKACYDTAMRMVEEGVSGSRIFRSIATSLIPQTEVWATKIAKQMRNEFKELTAVRGIV